MRTNTPVLRPSSVRPIALAFVAAFLPLAGSLHADNLFWNLPGDGTLNTGDSWNPASDPAEADKLYFELAGDYTVTSSAGVTVDYMEARGASGTLTLNFSGGTVRLGSTGYGTFAANQDVIFSGGKLEGSLQLGIGAGSKSVIFDGAGTELSGSGGHIGRTSSTFAANGNQLTIRNGATFSSTTTNALIIGSNTSKATANNNVVTVTGTGSSLISTGGVIIGNLASAESGAQAANNKLVITDGATATVGSLVLGRRATGSLLTATGNSVEVGNGSEASQLTVSTTVTIGSAGQNNVVAVRDGGTLLATGGTTTIVGRTGNGIQIYGGTYDASGQTIDASAGTLISLKNTGTLKAGSIVLNSTAQFGYANNGSAAFSGGHLQVGSLNASNATYTFTVGSNLGENAATYEMTGNGTHHFNSGLLISMNGRLKGSGTVHTGTKSLVNQGIIGSLTATTVIDLKGALSSAENAVYEIFIQDTDTYSRIISDSSIGVNGTLRLAFAEGFAPTVGAVFDLFDFTGMSGEFVNLELADPGAGLAWDTSNLYIDGTIAVIPEGGTYGFLLSGMAILFAAWHRIPSAAR